jgi:hypothetical protein
VPTNRRRQVGAPTELHERPRLAVILGIDAGHQLLIRWQIVIDLSDQCDLLLLAKAIRQGLRQAIGIV